MAVSQRNAIKVFEDNLPARDPVRVSKVNAITDVSRPALRNVSNVQRPTYGFKKDLLLKGKPHTQKENLDKEAKQPPKQKESDKAEEAIAHIEEDAKLLTDTDEVIKDIDENDGDNLTLCAEYVKDIYKYLRKSEKRLIPSDYMDRQKEISEKMRTILVDWLIQVHSKFNLLQETLYLTVYTIDRYLDKEIVKRSELQLVGVTAMLLASKYEEMYAPEVGDFVYITDNAYSKEKIKAMEQKMLKTLQYDFSNPLCLQFLRRNSKAGDMSAEKHTLAKFFMELTLVSYKFVCRYPSQLAAASLFLSIKIIDGSEWTPTLKYYSGYSESELLPVVGDMAALVLAMNDSKYEAVKQKYESSRLLRVSRMAGLRGATMKSYANYATNSVSTSKR